MIEVILNILGLAFLWFAVEYCLRHQTAESLDDASLIPFADDPEVARRVELATGKTVRTLPPQEANPDWETLDI
ncbi:cbb3-type cytochrome c oxidase subunit 3 [Pseudomonas sp. BF-R-30]|uniref:cbb3-type cytochrome c oxidase subunit 3 n=1 Tax=Pseudomonas sp. BF-R-30 TaxID=2832384 RepID=UPI001CBFCC45|nr:cbb3-type cytochrome c oxidase subunit 3 [Pseudomonas sp. BF-R-30]